MQATFPCSNCSTVLGVPKGGVPAEGITCNWCGHVNREPVVADPLPPVTKASVPKPAPAAPKPQPTKPTAPASPQQIICSNCENKIEVPKEGVPEEGIVCNWCGATLRKKASAKAKQAAATALPPLPASMPTAPEKQVAAKAPLHPYAEDDEDDGQPYEVPEDETVRDCEECGKEIDAHAVVCIHCGHNYEKRKKATRVYTPIDREWESGWSLPTRIKIFAGLMVLNIASIVIGLAVDGEMPAGFTVIFFMIALQAFLLGTFEKIRIRRNKKGQTEIWSQWRVFFLPLAPKKINWKAHEGIAFGHLNWTGITEWWVFICLLFMFIIPAIIWWWYFIRADRYFTALARDQEYPDVYLYRGLNEIQAKEMAQVASDATGLRLTTRL
jgi:hypothetical protein